MNPSIQNYINNVEEHARRTFKHRDEISMFLEIAEENSLQSEFEELIFISKFITNSRSILRRENTDNSLTLRLSDEFKIALQKSIQLITLLVANLSYEKEDRIKNKFLKPTPENLESLFNLLDELSWFKNYSIDAGSKNGN